MSFKVNATTIDNRPPVLHSISIDKTEVVAGEEITLTVEATDDLSGIEYIYAYFVNKENGREISFDFDLYDSETNDNGLYTTTVSINEFEPNGVFELKRVRLSDRSGSSYNNGNTVYYYSRNLEYDYDHEELYLPNEISFSIKENISSDNNPPVLQTISVDKVTVETPGFVTLTVGATDDLSGIEYIDVYFVNKENGRQIAFDLWDFETNDNGMYTTTVSINEFEPSGVFELEYVRLSDRSGSSYNNGNTVYYYSRNLGYHYDDEELYLPNELSFFVHNSDEEAEGDLVSSTTNENLAENIDDLEEGKTAYIYYGSEAELNKDVFEAVAGTDKQLVLSSEGIQWIFDGKDVEAEKAKSLDLDVTIREDYRSDSENSDNITEALDNKNSIIVSFPENGELPGPATIRIKMDYQFREYINYVDGEASVFVYYYDNTTGEFVEVASNLVVGDDEYLEFTITHNSDFVIVNGTPATSDDNSQNGSNNGSNNDKSENKENESNNDKSENKENESTSSSVTTNARTVPATGDKNSIGVAIALALFAVVCNVILINKKTSKYK